MNTNLFDGTRSQRIKIENILLRNEEIQPNGRKSKTVLKNIITINFKKEINKLVWYFKTIDSKFQILPSVLLFMNLF